MITVVPKASRRSAGATRAYIGRANPKRGIVGSPLANPYRLLSVGGTYTRDESVDAFAALLRSKLAAKDPATCAEMNRLYQLAKHGDLELECYCAPLRCHGDVIKQVLEEALRRSQCV